MKNTKNIDIFRINGVKVVNFKHESELAFFGIATWNGSNYEIPEIAGVSHFAEHMFFKGSKKRSAEDIAKDFARIGADYNAYTSNNEVVYFANSHKDNIENVIEIITDLFYNFTMPEEELEKERNVIIEEKKMYDDNPKHAFLNLVGEKFFRWNIGHETIGTFDTIKKISRNDIINYLQNKINLGNLSFIFSGNIPSEQLKKILSKYVLSYKNHIFHKKGNINVCRGKFWSNIINTKKPIKLEYQRENITQSDVYMITKGLSVLDPDFYSSVLAILALGGGSYSDLFLRIREDLGLCYSVGIYNNFLSYPDEVSNVLYGYTSPDKVELFIKESEKVIRNNIKNGISKDSFECAKSNMITDAIRQYETTVGKAMHNIRRCFYGNKKNMELSNELNKIKKLTIEDCSRVLKKIFSQQFNWAVMNPK